MQISRIKNVNRLGFSLVYGLKGFKIRKSLKELKEQVLIKRPPRLCEIASRSRGLSTNLF